MRRGSGRAEKEEPDGAWIRTALERYERPLCRFAARLLGDRERARDCVQETFLRLCREPRAKVEGHLREWLFTVCRNRAIDVRAREKAREEAMATDGDGVLADTGAHERRNGTALEVDPARRSELREETGRLSRLVAALPDTQRDVLLLKFQEGLSYKEISGVTGHTVSNVGFLLHRGIRTLRGQLVESEERTRSGRSAT